MRGVRELGAAVVGEAQGGGVAGEQQQEQEAGQNPVEARHTQELQERHVHCVSVRSRGLRQDLPYGGGELDHITSDCRSLELFRPCRLELLLHLLLPRLQTGVIAVRNSKCHQLFSPLHPDQHRLKALGAGCVPSLPGRRTARKLVYTRRTSWKNTIRIKKRFNLI